MPFSWQQYKRIPGTAERYRRGKHEISRRQYQNLKLKGSRYAREVEKAKAYGYRSIEERERIGKSEKYKIQLEQVYSSNQRVDMARFRSNFMKVERMRREKVSKFDPRMRDPDGPLAELLVARGYREPNATYQVGDSPGAKK